MIEIEVEDSAWTVALSEAETLVRAAAEAALGAGDQPAGGDNISVLLTDDASVQDLNARFRDKSAPTNVLSFPAGPNPENLLGDIALAYGVCAREAIEQGKSLADHLQHLTVHGVLHLLGYDHISDDEAEVMEDLERAVLARLGVSDPYGAGEGEHDRS
ncbi:MAG: rRNA maturation RNase YbeY [Alphaproteobacteria bacterium]